MKPIRPVKKWVLTAIGLLLALLFLKIIWLLTARPKATVDYMAEYNRISRPKDFDPNLNAAAVYQKAFDALTQMPNINLFRSNVGGDSNSVEAVYPGRMYGLSRRVEWPADLDDANQEVLRQWLASNESALEHFRAASRRPYYWIERENKRNEALTYVVVPELGNWRRLTDAVTWNARLKAVDGKYQEAFDNILSCYRAACQNCRNSSLLAEQSFGIMLKERILNVAVVILDRSKPRPADLKKLQDSLQGEFDSDTFVVDFETEKLVYYDILQRIFVYNRKGTGRLACSEAVRNGGRHYHWETFFACLIGPTENEMKRRIDEVFTSVESIKGLTPWQLNLRQSDFFGKLSLTKCENCYDFGLDSFFISFRPSSLYRGFYRQKAREEALLAILAVHRFRAEKGSFPASLDELVSNGFLQHLPPDPFSDGPLVYRADVNDFTLYSVGEDFKDDGGKGIGNAMTGFSRSRSPALDIVFWPPARPQPPDIFSLPLLPPRQPEKPATRPVPDI